MVTVIIAHNGRESKKKIHIFYKNVGVKME